MTDLSTLRVAALSGLLTLLGSQARATELPRLEHEFYTLDNGLEVILHEDHSTPIVGVNVWYHVGSKNERPGRSGFAHLFEHMMFQGSEHHDQDYFQPLQEVGGTLNGSTNTDRTNYWELVPAQHLERALLLEADRMGWLLPAMTQEKLDNQRDVVRNERRQGEGQPYSAFWNEYNRLAYPPGHPYDHSVIGEHEDLVAASLDDVKDFFRTYYTPNNATLSIAGDFDPAQVKAWVERYFGPIPPGPPLVSMAAWIPEVLTERRIRLEDRVQLRRFYYVWHTPPAFAPGDAELELAASILGRGKNSRLYKRLVHETRLAQDVSAFSDAQQICSDFFIEVTLRDGADAQEVESIIDEELARMRRNGPTGYELERVQSDREADFVRSLQRVGSWGGKNDRLNRYNHYVGTPDYLQKDLDRYLDATPAGVREAFAEWIGAGRFVFEVHPFGNLNPSVADEGLDRGTFPEPTEGTAASWPAAQRTTIENGLQVTVMPHEELPLVEARLVFLGGSASDPRERSGLTGLAASMLLEGVRGLDVFAFQAELDRLGTEISVSTHDDHVVLSMNSLKKHLDRSLELLALTAKDATFNSEQFGRMKERRLVDVRRDAERANVVVEKVAARVVYGDTHPYGAFPTEESLEAIALADVTEHAARHFTPGNATLILVGDLTAAEAEAAVRQHFGDWTGAAPAVAPLPPAPELGERTIYLVDKPGDPQSTIRIAHLGPVRATEDWEELQVANRVLGGFFSSRLNMNLREDKGYSYGVSSSFGARRGAGLFSMGGRVQVEVTAPALVEMMHELEEIHGPRPIAPDELEFAKRSIVLSYPSEFETCRGLANALVAQTVLGLPEETMQRYPEWIDAVTLKQANDAARTYFDPDRAAVVIVGDRSKIESAVAKLGLGSIRFLDAEGVPVPAHEEIGAQNPDAPVER